MRRRSLCHEQSAKLGAVGGVVDTPQVLDCQGTCGVVISTPPRRQRILFAEPIGNVAAVSVCGRVCQRPSAERARESLPGVDSRSGPWGCASSRGAGTGHAASPQTGTGVGGTTSGKQAVSSLFSAPDRSSCREWHRRRIAGEEGEQVLGQRSSHAGHTHRRGGGNSFTPLHLQSDSHFGKWHNVVEDWGVVDK